MSSSTTSITFSQHGLGPWGIPVISDELLGTMNLSQLAALIVWLMARFDEFTPAWAMEKRAATNEEKDSYLGKRYWEFTNLANRAMLRYNQHLGGEDRRQRSQAMTCENMFGFHVVHKFSRRLDPYGKNAFDELHTRPVAPSLPLSLCLACLHCCAHLDFLPSRLHQTDGLGSKILPMDSTAPKPVKLPKPQLEPKSMAFRRKELIP
ncbi:hypothetical protein F5Y16DRAFT_400378 [Xylariaceae sp. FL0255]|nr:hypothetical protein F5Y16DRAFT_400378 [Xylariaceae sp. FL0255]